MQWFVTIESDWSVNRLQLTILNSFKLLYCYEISIEISVMFSVLSILNDHNDLSVLKINHPWIPVQNLILYNVNIFHLAPELKMSDAAGGLIIIKFKKWLNP